MPRWIYFGGAHAGITLQVRDIGRAWGTSLAALGVSILSGPQVMATVVAKRRTLFYLFDVYLDRYSSDDFDYSDALFHREGLLVTMNTV